MINNNAKISINLLKAKCLYNFFIHFDNFFTEISGGVAFYFCEMATLRKDNVIFTLIAKIDEAGKNLDKIDNKVGGLQGTFAKAGKAFQGIIAAGAVTAAVAGITKVTNAALKQAGAFEKTVVSYNTLVGNVKQSAALVKQLEQFSVVTPFTPEEVIQSGKTLLAFGVDSTKVAENLQSLGEASAATGADLNNLAVVFGQVRGAGRLMGQDLLQFVNAGVPIISLLAEEMDVAESEIKDLVSQGRVTFPVLERAFKRASDAGGRFEGALRKQSQTLEGLQSTAQGVRDAFFRAFGQRILEPAKAFQRAMIGIWETARDFVAVGLADELRDEQVQLNVLVGRITDANENQEDRNRLIRELQEDYPDFLKNIDAETVSNTELRDRLKEVNEQYFARIALAEIQAQVDDAEEKVRKRSGRAAQREIDLRTLLNEEITATSAALTDEERALIGNTEGFNNQLETLKSILESRAKFSTSERTGVITPLNEEAKLLREINNLSAGRSVQTGLSEDAQSKLNELLKIRNDLQKEFEGILGTGDGETGSVPPVKDKPDDKDKEKIKTLAEAIAETFDEAWEAQQDGLLSFDTEFFVRIQKRIKEGVAISPADLLTPVTAADDTVIADGLEKTLRSSIDKISQGELFNEFGRRLFAGPDVEPDLSFLNPDEDTRLEDRIYQMVDAYYFMNDVAQQFFDAEIQRTEALISVQEQRVRRAVQTAERGNAEQLQLEEDRLNELLLKRERAAQRQRQLDAAQIVAANAVAAAESVKAIAQGFSGPGSIFQGIATVVALAASIGSIILAVNNAFNDLPAFDVGEEYLHSDMVAQVHKGERILTAKQNAELGAIPNSEIPGLVRDGQAARLEKHYLYAQNSEAIALMQEQLAKQDQIIEAIYGDAGRMGRYFKSGRKIGSIKKRALVN